MPLGIDLGKAEKQNICSNGKKREASWIGAKSPNRGKSPKAKKGEASQIGGKVEKQNICPNGKKKEAGWLGEKLKNRIFAPTGRKKRKTGRSKETEKRRIAPTERNKITKIKISGGKLTWIL